MIKNAVKRFLICCRIKTKAHFKIRVQKRELKRSKMTHFSCQQIVSNVRPKSACLTSLNMLI